MSRRVSPVTRIPWIRRILRRRSVAILVVLALVLVLPGVFAPSADARSGSGDGATATDASDCAAGPQTVLTLASIDGADVGVGAMVHPGDVARYRLLSTNACARSLPNFAVSVHLPAGASYAGAGEGWSFPTDAGPSRGFGSQLVNLPGHGRFTGWFTVRMADPMPTGQSSVDGWASASLGSCACQPHNGYDHSPRHPGGSGGSSSSPASPSGPPPASGSVSPSPTGPSTPAAAPVTITAVHTVVGRAAAADQVSARVADQYGRTLGSARTSASAPTAATSAITVRADRPYTVVGTLTDGSVSAEADYVSTIACVDASGAVVATSGAGPSWTVVAPATGAVVCTVTSVAVPTGSLDTTLALAEVNGAAVNGAPADGLASGDLVTYELTVRNSADVRGATTLTETIPAGSTYAGDSGGWTIAGSSATQRVYLGANSSATVPFTVRLASPLPPNTTSIAAAVTSSNGTCSACALTAPTAGLLATSLTLLAINGAAAAPGDQVERGDVLTYQAAVTNTGGTPATTTVTESNPPQTSYSGPAAEGWAVSGGAAIRGFTVPAGGAVVAAPFTVTVNNPLTLGTTQIGNQLTTSAGSCVACAVTNPVPTFEVSKTASTAVARPGDVVTYTIAVRSSLATDAALGFSDNLGDLLDDASYDNDATGGAILSGRVLTWALPVAAGATASVSYSVRIADPDAGNRLLAGVLQTTADGNCATASPTCAQPQVRVQSFAATIAPDTTRVNPGGRVSYTVTVRNTGTVDYTAAAPALFGVDLTGVLDDAWINATTGGPTRTGNVLRWALPLAAGASATVTVTVRVDVADDGDHALRAAVVSAAGSGGGCPAGSAVPSCVAGVVGVQSFAVSLGSSAPKANPGERVDYTLTVRNTGTVDYTAADSARFSVDLAGVLDDATYLGNASGGATLAGTTLSWRIAIAAGATVTLTYSVVLADPDLGDHRLTSTLQSASAGGNCASAAPEAACSPASVGVQSFVVVKTSSATSTGPGGVVTYTITVQNTGTVDYTTADPARIDDDLSDVLDDATYHNDALGSPTRSGNVLSWRLALPAGALTTITYSVTVNSPDTGNHKLLNSVQTPPGSGGNCPAGSVDVACSPPAAGSQSYTVAITADRTAAVAGDTVTFTVAVRNTGATAYTASHPVTFTDDLARVLDDAAYNHDATGGATLSGKVLSWSFPLAVNAAVTVHFSVTVNSPDAGDARLSNSVATPAAGSGNCAPTMTDPNCAVLVAVARLALLASASPATMRTAGDPITYSFTVLNTGGLTVTDVHLAALSFTGADPAQALGACAAPFATLAPGASQVCTVPYAVTQADLDSGRLTSTVAAHGIGPAGADIASNQSTAVVDAQPMLTVAISTVTTDVNGDGVVDAGDRIEWLITVSNTGRSVASSLRISDGLAGTTGPCGHIALTQGGQTDCRIATYTVRTSDANTVITNTAVAMGVDLSGYTVVSAPASAGVHVLASSTNRAGSGITGTGSRLLLITLATLVAVAGLFLLAGLRRRTA